MDKKDSVKKILFKQMIERNFYCEKNQYKQLKVFQTK